MLYELKLCTSNNIDIGTFWWSYAEKATLVSWENRLLNLHTVLQWCYGCYSNHAGGSRHIPNFLCTTSRQYLHDLFCLKLSTAGLFWCSYAQNHRGPVFWDTVYIKFTPTQNVYKLQKVHKELLITCTWNVEVWKMSQITTINEATLAFLLTGTTKVHSLLMRLIYLLKYHF